MQVWMIVAGLAFLMMLGSILWIMPSKRDRRIAKLRQAAILRKIKVKLIKYPLINLSGRVEEGAIEAAAYSFDGIDEEEINAGWMLIRSYHTAEQEPDDNAPEGWAWYINQQALPDDIINHMESFLLRYSEQVQALSVMMGGITIGWNEQGTLEDLESFEVWVEQLRQLLISYFRRLKEERIENIRESKS